MGFIVYDIRSEKKLTFKNEFDALNHVTKNNLQSVYIYPELTDPPSPGKALSRDIIQTRKMRYKMLRKAGYNSKEAHVLKGRSLRKIVIYCSWLGVISKTKDKIMADPKFNPISDR